MFLYICESCKYSSEDDFWDCPKCLEEVRVFEVEITHYETGCTVKFHPDVDYVTAETLLSYIPLENMKMSHAQHAGENFRSLLFSFDIERTT